MTCQVFPRTTSGLLNTRLGHLQPPLCHCLCCEIFNLLLKCDVSHFSKGISGFKQNCTRIPATLFAVVYGILTNPRMVLQFTILKTKWITSCEKPKNLCQKMVSKVVRIFVCSHLCLWKDVVMCHCHYPRMSFLHILVDPVDPICVSRFRALVEFPVTIQLILCLY